MNWLKYTCCLLVGVFGVEAGALAAEAEYTARDFGRLPQYDSAALSTNGTYLALRIPEPSESNTGHVKKRLVVLRMKDRKPVSVLRFPGDESVADLFWDSDERLIIRSAVQLGWDDRPALKPDIYAMNADGSKKTVIYGPGVLKDGGSRAKKSVQDNMPGWVIDPLPNDEQHILVLKATGEVIKLNTYSATQSTMGRAPSNFANVVTDQQGNVRYATGITEFGEQIVYAMTESGWSRVHEAGAMKASWEPVAMHEDGKRVYISSQLLGPTTTTAIWDPSDNSVTPVYRHDVVDHNEIWSTDGYSLLGFVADAGYPEYVITNETHPEAQLRKKLIASFPKQWVSVLDVTKDARFALLSIASATNPGDYYLFDVENNKAEYLVSQRGWLDPAKMSEVRPFSMKARDGLVLHGYLTLPRGKEPKNLPMVVMVHGGPHGPRDGFGFDPQVQFLANRGYAVLQVNYRGSGGYGKAFELSGYRKWGREMQNDVTDATLWAVAEGIADRARICIAGGSYGGYATGMGLVREPDLYQCGVGGVGVYDLTLMYDKGDIQRRTSGVKYLERAIGTDEAELKANSAVYNVDKIKKPVFLWHGDLDERVPPAHYHRFAEALKKAGKPVELLMKDKEGHGFVNEDNRTELFERTAAFLSKHIGN
ncbi:MAG: alpha/beta hydrolase family protein [Pseudomonadota bacterium]